MAQTFYGTSGTVYFVLNYTPKFTVWEYKIRKITRRVLKNKNPFIYFTCNSDKWNLLQRSLSGSSVCNNSNTWLTEQHLG